MLGAQLPTITLAVNQNVVHETIDIIREGNNEALESHLSVSGNFSILDGLQRTYILHEISEEGYQFNSDQKLLLEFWVEPEVKHLIYRLIVLNAGQKPMSMRHQLELLFLTMAEKLRSDISNLELFVETENRRRSQPKQYPLDRLVEGYQAFLWKTQELSKDNIVAQQMLEGSVLDSSEDSLNESFELFKTYLQYLVLIDEKVFSVYRESENTSFSHWIASENVIVAYFGSIADYSIDENRKKRVQAALQRLITNLSQSNNVYNDPLGIEQFNALVRGFQTKKVNVGVATRKLLFNGFKEFFREEGDKSLASCWLTSAE